MDQVNALLKEKMKSLLGDLGVFEAHRLRYGNSLVLESLPVGFQVRERFFRTHYSWRRKGDNAAQGLGPQSCAEYSDFLD